VVVTALITIKTKDVQLWYPRGYGEQRLYALRVGFNGHHMKKRIGLLLLLLLLLLLVLLLLVVLLVFFFFVIMTVIIITTIVALSHTHTNAHT